MSFTPSETWGSLNSFEISMALFPFENTFGSYLTARNYPELATLGKPDYQTHHDKQTHQAHLENSS